MTLVDSKCMGGLVRNRCEDLSRVRIVRLSVRIADVVLGRHQAPES